jgi:hypothetical protein
MSRTIPTSPTWPEFSVWNARTLTFWVGSVAFPSDESGRRDPMNGTSESQILATGWLAKQADVHLDGTILTSPSYIVQGWLDAVVPGSVLATLVKNKKVPDPYFGDYSKALLDISDTGPHVRGRAGFTTGRIVILR